MWALHRWQPWTIPGGAALNVAGLALMLSSIALTPWSVVTFRRTHDRHPLGAGLGDGHHRPLSTKRQPDHLADAIAYLSGSLLIHSWWPLVMQRKVVDREERYLTERFGEPNREYQLCVRRWL
jgi:protein-S-isoprenylcysteine O-methyltransferase Ste14